MRAVATVRGAPFHRPARREAAPVGAAWVTSCGVGGEPVSTHFCTSMSHCQRVRVPGSGGEDP